MYIFSIHPDGFSWNLLLSVRKNIISFYHSELFSADLHRRVGHLYDRIQLFLLDEPVVPMFSD